MDQFVTLADLASIISCSGHPIASRQISVGRIRSFIACSSWPGGGAFFMRCLYTCRFVFIVLAGGTELFLACQSYLDSVIFLNLEI